MNSFDDNIQFTLEEVTPKLPFLNVHLERNGEGIMFSVYRKLTSNDAYGNWCSFSPESFKRGTLKSLIDCVYLKYSSDKILEKESKYVGKVFCEEMLTQNSLFLNLWIVY